MILQLLSFVKTANDMIISAVSLVNNYKFSDFILDKIKEEQCEQDEESRKRHKRSSLCAPNVHKVSAFFWLVDFVD